MARLTRYYADWDDTDCKWKVYDCYLHCYVPGEVFDHEYQAEWASDEMNVDFENHV